MTGLDDINPLMALLPTVLRDQIRAFLAGACDLWADDIAANDQPQLEEIS